MECEEDYSIFSEDVERELRTAMMDYHVRRSNEDEQEGEEDMTNSEDSSEGGSDGEMNEGEDDFAFEYLEADTSESSKVEAFIRESCGCQLGEQEKPCSSTIAKEEFVDCRNNCLELTSTELDMTLLGVIHSSINCSELSTSGRTEKARKRTRIPFFYHGRRICRKTFLFLHRIHQRRFYSLLKHYKKNGLSVRVHGNNKRLPTSTSSPETIENVVKFIRNVAEEQALLLPGRVPGFKRTDVKLLPSTLTKHSLWKTYQDLCNNDCSISVGYSKFCDLWNQLCPFVIIMRPATDLCWTCQKNNSRIHKSANLPEAQKAEVVKAQEQHLRLASGERDLYKTCCKESKDSLAPHLRNVDFSNEQEPCSYAGTVHYSYDYAQQLHYPANPNQPGPIYFKTPRKCALFGVCCEGVPRQVNYLIDENVCTGKGANATISYVHHFFTRHGVGETDAQMHADNCGAQNKNNPFIWYYLWRVMTGLHHSIEYHFLIAGHTKFSPDWCFGLVKKKTRRTYISSLFDIARAVEESASVNTAELVGLHNGAVRVIAYDWMTYLEQYFKKLPHLKSYHHFRFHRDHPGTVFCKEYWNSEERAINILRNEANLPEPGELPQIVNPKGMSRERREYLYKEIREFCRVGTEDLVAPQLY